LVIYEDSMARTHILNVSPQLAEPGAPDSKATIHWFSFEAIGGSAASIAAGKAIAAEWIVFAFTPGGDLPGTVKQWIEGWIGRRREAEGAIIGLATRPPAPGQVACLKEIHLRHAALRAGMDYLSNVPLVLPEPMPDSPDFYTKRAGQITSVLDDILRCQWPPPTLPR
jgi:hypothetical protein